MESKKLEWLKDYQRTKRNPIFFIEEYYNKLYSENKIYLTDEEKQFIYDKYRTNMIPLFNEGDDMTAYYEHCEKIEELKKQGYRDWELI